MSNLQDHILRNTCFFCPLGIYNNHVDLLLHVNLLSFICEEFLQAENREGKILVVVCANYFSAFITHYLI